MRWIAGAPLIALALAGSVLAPGAEAQSNTLPDGRCAVGFADADGNRANGCEVNLMIDPRNCGAVGRAVGPGQICTAGVPASAYRGPITVVDVTLDRNPGLGFNLGRASGPTRCTGEGDARACVTPIGTQSGFADRVGARDNNTGRTGTVEMTCDVRMAGTTTTYAAKDGVTNATGTQDCVLQMQFGNDRLYGSMHQSRVVVNNVETSTMSFQFSGGMGAYFGFFGQQSQSRRGTWTAPAPLGTKGAQQYVGRAPDARESRPGLRLRRALRPVASVATASTLAPTNEAVVLKVAAAPGSRCRGSIAGARTIELPGVRASRRGVASFGTLPAGTFAGGMNWTVRVVCTGRDGGAIAQADLASYDVQPG